MKKERKKDYNHKKNNLYAKQKKKEWMEEYKSL
jgi:hypothetical protein